jgi:cytidine deaminase
MPAIEMPSTPLSPRSFDPEQLYQLAEKARADAYAPYSNFTVGAALLTTSGRIITAGNVENASFGLTICAERSAVVHALAVGQRDFFAIAVAGDTDRVHTLAPCGACLQVLAEFDMHDDLQVVFPEGDELRVEPLSRLLPVRFRLHPAD